MAAPSDDPLARLTWFERATFRASHLMATRLKWFSVFWASRLGWLFVLFAVGRRIRPAGLDAYADVAPEDSVLMVSNHRSFFDFYVITTTLFARTRLSRQTLFPVRSTYFYDHPTGPLVNMLMSGMQMFPPMLRDDRGREFNRYSMALLSDLLRRPGCVVGMHPEGTRNKTGTAYHLLKARPGVGQLVLEAPNARVMPMFILGMSNSIPTEMLRNWSAPEKSPIDVVFGSALDFAEQRAAAHRLHAEGRALDSDGEATDELRALWHEVADACLQAVARLGERQRAIARDREVAQLTDDGETQQRARA